MSAQVWELRETNVSGEFDVHYASEYVMTIRGTDPDTINSLVDFWNNSERLSSLLGVDSVPLPNEPWARDQIARLAEHTTLGLTSATSVVLGAVMASWYVLAHPSELTLPDTSAGITELIARGAVDEFVKLYGKVKDDH